PPITVDAYQRPPEQRSIPAQFAVNPRANEPAPVQFAGGAGSKTAVDRSAAGAQPTYLSGPSWYRDRMRAVANGTLPTDSPVGTSVPINNAVAAPMNLSKGNPSTPLAKVTSKSADGWRGRGWRSSSNPQVGPQRQSVARPQEPQRVGVQVLEMGSSMPIRAGAQSSLQLPARTSALPPGHVGPSSTVPKWR
ncbi:MAG: hypothetical protein AAGG44_14535, partial [Planctomycetota bacterium]